MVIVYHENINLRISYFPIQNHLKMTEQIIFISYLNFQDANHLSG